MKKLNNSLLLYITLVLIILGQSSCVNDLDVTPIDPSVNQTFDQNAVFAKIYAGFQLTGLSGPTGNPDVSAADEGNFGLYRAFWNLNELSSDEACWPYEANAGILGIQINSPNSSNAFVQNFYEYSYIEIVMCNSFLEQTAKSTDAITAKQRAEIRFLRAFYYSNLLDLYGNVPFVTEVSSELPQQIKRADLFKWIEQELITIAPDMYQTKAHDYYRVDVVANWLLLSRLYLNAKVYTGTERWNDAAIYAKKVIDSEYKLATNYRYLFMGDNAGIVDGSSVNDAPNEIIFPVAANGKKISSYAGSCYLVASCAFSTMTDPKGTKVPNIDNFLPKSRWGCNRVRASLIGKFFANSVLPSGAESEINLSTIAGDNRALFYANKRPVAILNRTNTDQGLTTFKFTNGRADGDTLKISDQTMPDMDIPLMRLAEAYLTYAEAVTRGAATVGGFTAKDAVKIIRDRAHAKEITTITLNVILDEWSREFYFEGRRRSDLIRFDCFGGNTDYTWDWKGGTLAGSKFSADFNLYPIPATDLSANSNLKQNNGYN